MTGPERVRVDPDTVVTQQTAYDGVAYDAIGNWLQQRFGDGENYLVRYRWYERVQTTVCEEGPRAFEIMRDLAERAMDKNRPDRWFIASLTRQFEAKRWW